MSTVRKTVERAARGRPLEFIRNGDFLDVFGMDFEDDDDFLTERTTTAMSMIRKLNERTAISDGLLEYVLSDGSVDGYGDIIEPAGWQWDAHLIALFNHDPNFPVGVWENIRVENRALRGRLKLAPKGTSSRIDEISKLVQAGVLRGCSVGFLPLEAEPLPGKKGVRYKKQLLRECSVCSIPANSNAVAQQARALGISDATIKAVLAQSPNATLAERQARARIRREELMRAERARSRARTSARTNPADANFDPFSLEGLTHEERMAVIRAKAEMPYAVPQSDNPWQEEPSLFFNGKPMFSKRGPYGW